MAEKKTTKKTALSNKTVTSEPKFPYTKTPGSLRRLLQEIPTKPKPPKFNKDTLQAWGYMNSNDQYNIRVLKAVGLVSPSNETTSVYAEFMSPETGALVLGKEVKKVYEQLFDTVSEPEKASDEELRRFFNVHSGGSDETLRLQMQTFKALASHATFGESDALEGAVGGVHGGRLQGGNKGGPTININLHIHLPENKTKLEYEAIIDRIAASIYGQDT